MPYHESGITSLVLLALSHGGMDIESTPVMQGLAWLREQKPEGTYAVSLQTLALARIVPESGRAIVERNVSWLEAAQSQDGKFAGAWSYRQAHLGIPGDNSNSQFAILALHAAAELGVEIEEATWKRARQYWIECANTDGSWGYTKDVTSGKGSMTCGGVTSLLIAAKHLPAEKNGNADECVTKGIEWLGRNFSVFENPGTGDSIWLHYYLSGIARLGAISARREFGRHDWYVEGSRMLVDTQDVETGKWTNPRLQEPTVHTAFALLFLASHE